MGLRGILLLAFFALGACGVAGPFGYRYYNLKPESYAGLLEGNERASDKPLSDCAPVGKEKNRCTVMFTRDAYKLKDELLNCRERVKCFESGRCK